MQTCLKCGYTRQPTDDASPAGVCPKCGVAYAKARPGTSRAFTTLGKAPDPDPITDKLERGLGVLVVTTIMFAFAVILAVLTIPAAIFAERGQGGETLLYGFAAAIWLYANGLLLRYLHGIYVNTLKR
jgi:hypothetical protein